MYMIKLRYNWIWLCYEYIVTLIYLIEKTVYAKPEKTKTKKGNLTNIIGSCVNGLNKLHFKDRILM